MGLSEHIMLWNHVSIKVLDVRHIMMGIGEELRGYRLPASAFLYTVGGKAQVRLDDSVFAATRFYLLHGGQGMYLDIAAEEIFEYYLILYKAKLILPANRKLVHLMEGDNPFQQQYSFVPDYPVSLLDQVEKMYGEWMKSNPLDSFHAKTLFYQFIHELLGQMHRQTVTPVKPDLVARAVRYIHEHYREPITLDAIANSMDCSARYLNKLFNNKLNNSPIRILTLIRLDKAAKLLTHTDATLQEIAESVGYPDGHALSRIFKKHYRMSPAMFRKQAQAGRMVPKLPLSGSKSAIVHLFPQVYIDYDNQYHIRGEGHLPMYRGTKPSMAATFMLCIALLLSACSNGTANIHTGNGGTTMPSQQAAERQTTDLQQSSGSTATTRSYSDSQGHLVDIPINPQRIVLQGNVAGDFWALGVEPVGLDRRFIEGSENLYRESVPAQDIGFPTNIEKVLSLEPDLTMLGYVMDKQYEELSKVSPVVVFDQNGLLQDRLPLIADIIGKKTEAEKWLADYQLKTDAMWRELRAQGKIKEGDTAVILIYYWDRTMYIMKTGGLAQLIYQPNGFGMDPVVEALEPNAGPYIQVTEEVLHDQLIGDHLFVLYPENADALKEFDDLAQTPLWGALSQIKNGRYYLMDSKWNYSDAMTSAGLLDELPHIMAK